MNNLPTRRALGEEVIIGTLYDANTDSFLPASILHPQLPEGAISAAYNQKTEFFTSQGHSYKQKFELLGIGPDLGASVLGGAVHPKGAGNYIGLQRTTDASIQASLLHRITTVNEILVFPHPELRSYMNSDGFRYTNATHLVAGIEWGAQTVVEYAAPTGSGAMKVETLVTSLQGEIQKLRNALGDQASNGADGIGAIGAGASQAASVQFDITAYSDICPDEGVMVHTVSELQGFIQMVPLHIQHMNSGRGKPLQYQLLPLDMFCMMMAAESHFARPSLPIPHEYLDRLLQLFDELTAGIRKLNDYQVEISRHRSYVAPGHIDQVKQIQRELTNGLDSLKFRYSETLREVRGGTKQYTALNDLHRDFVGKDSNPLKRQTLILGEMQKAEFASEVVAKGGQYVGYNGPALSQVLAQQGSRAAYVLFYDEATMKSPDWEPNRTLLDELLSTDVGAGQSSMVIVDCDATSKTIEKPQVAFYEQGQEICADVLEQRKYRADKSFARFLEDTVETGVDKPLKRRLVKIPCPSPSCDRTQVCKWYCQTCVEPLEYGFIDEYLYCHCGRSHYRNFDFKCPSPTHGPGFEQYDPAQLLQLLKSLSTGDYLNILILGETGVGKSTFINAFVNYLMFDTLDEAKKASELSWVIPCSFSTQIMDRNNPGGRIRQIQVKVGEDRKDEADGSKGASATQMTSVYPVTIGGRVIRLIDTPGIGDTRGIAYDKKNMDDILQTLSNYEDLHGILILVKSNNARLTVTFNFCMKELLTHLHRSAAANMVFGFTNTRISNYTPGDTFGPLSSLLKDHADVGLDLVLDTTYCFDSESFRYLAAFKKGVPMDNEEDFRRSWQHSRQEAWRLIDYFTGRHPHSVKSTVSLNGARQLIAELTKPMAEISTLIRTNIQISEDQMQELKTTRLQGDDLRQRLHLQQAQLKPRQLDNPRTVCSSPSCVTYKDDGTGQGKVVTVYETHCHPVCYLDDVRADQIAAVGLIHCYAFQGSDTCRNCSHRWQEHLHVLYELEEFMGTVKDTAVEALIEQHASDVDLKEAAIEDLKKLIAEYKQEHHQIQEAAALFGIFLKQNSITPYNNKTIEYLDMLIQEEQGKIQAGGSKKRLQTLLEDRKTHEELVAAMTASMKSNPRARPLDEAGVEQVVQKLYRLKHFGKNLQNVKNTIASAHQATNRERPFRIQSGGRGLPRSPRSSKKQPRQPHHPHHGGASGGFSYAAAGLPLSKSSRSHGGQAPSSARSGPGGLLSGISSMKIWGN